ncbi:MAG: hypothetical protein NXI13_00690 [Proteobacteria bacterium]|nr:hypothetical protein [Pseudomonadota bacterium]
MIKRISLALLLLVVAMGGVQAETAEQKVFKAAENDCKAFENGVFSTTRKAIPRIDLTGDGIPDTIIDSLQFRCSTAGTLWCGTGGCEITIIVEGKPYEFLAKGWKVVDWTSFKVLLLQVHGSQCGGTNLLNCVRAVVWSDGDFRSVEGG